MTALLNVDHSLRGQRWIGPAIEQQRLAEAMAQVSDLPLPLCATLVRLGVGPADSAAYLSPAIRDLLPDPRQLRDMETAAKRFLDAIAKQQRVAIFADYDVDGGASAALLMDWLGYANRQATLYVPDRIEEGYGPNAPAMAELAKNHDLIVCVDCGTLSHDPIAAAIGADVIVIDHHLGGETLPPAYAVVNPNRQDESGDLGHLCAAAVVFLFLVECNRQNREAGKPTPNLMDELDLVALATVADVAPLSGVNRAFVRQGLRVMARRARPGLAALADAARLDTAPRAYHLGYVLGPRVNAGGRVGRADLGARLLSTRDMNEAGSIADRLEQLNKERRDVEDHVRAAAMAQAEERGLDGPLAWAAGEGWHPGVVGIVASRLKEMTHRPSIVIGIEDGIGKGSGRSVKGVDLGSIIHRVAAEGLIERGGGHKMAAGLTVSAEKLDAAMARIAELITRQGVDLDAPREMRIDGVLMPGAATLELLDQIEAAGPYGAGAAAPRFVFPGQQITFAKQVGATHLKLRFGDGANSLDAISFGAFDTDLGPRLLDHGGQRFHLAGQLDLNQWQGRKSVQLRLEDAALSE